MHTRIIFHRIFIVAALVAVAVWLLFPVLSHAQEVIPEGEVAEEEAPTSDFLIPPPPTEEPPAVPESRPEEPPEVNTNDIPVVSSQFHIEILKAPTPDTPMSEREPTGIILTVEPTDPTQFYWMRVWKTETTNDQKTTAGDGSG